MLFIQATERRILRGLLLRHASADRAPSNAAPAAPAFVLDLASPWWVARYTHTMRPHPEHLPERFGLFTIILIGGGMAAVVHALDHGPVVHSLSLGLALALLRRAG